jgi:hypothetical protein
VALLLVAAKSNDPLIAVLVLVFRVVYEVMENIDSVLKIAKPRSYSRDHLKLEHDVTRLFESRGIGWNCMIPDKIRRYKRVGYL